MSAGPESPVAIVGAGPTGLTCAALLRASGVPCRVLDRAPSATEHSRAIGVSARSLEVLDSFGAAEQLVAAGLPSRTANFYARGRRIARLTSAKVRDTRFPYLLAVPQSATERVLERRLRELGGTVERGVEVLAVEADGAGVRLRERVDGAERGGSAGWVVAADGSHSTVRGSLGIEFEGSATGRAFANVDLALDPPPPAGEGHYHFCGEGLLVIAPLPGGRFRVTALVGEEEAAGAPLDESYLQRLIDSRTGWRARVRSVSDSGWGVVIVPVQARLARSFASGRCLLAGDAAHVFGPTGAQGMNTGIQDAHNLAWKLALVVGGQADGALLDSYEAERRPVAEEVNHAVEMQTRMATISSAPGRALRNAALRALTATGVVDRKLAPRISQLDVDYSGTPWARCLRRGAPAGRRCPDVSLGGGESLYPRLRGHLFNLILLGGGAPPGGERTVAGVSLGVHSIAARDADRGLGPRDVSGSLAEFLGGSGAALLRPDGHVAAAGSLEDRGAILEHLRRQLLGRGPRPAVSLASRMS